MHPAGHRFRSSETRYAHERFGDVSITTIAGARRSLCHERDR